jgi:hypothetical protein
MLNKDDRFSDPVESVEVDLLDRNTSITTVYWDGFNSHVRKSSRNRARERKLERGGGGARERGLSFCSLGCVLSSHVPPTYIGDGLVSGQEGRGVGQDGPTPTLTLDAPCILIHLGVAPI